MRSQDWWRKLRTFKCEDMNSHPKSNYFVYPTTAEGDCIVQSSSTNTSRVLIYRDPDYSRRGPFPHES